LGAGGGTSWKDLISPELLALTPQLDAYKEEIASGNLVSVRISKSAAIISLAGENVLGCIFISITPEGQGRRDFYFVLFACKNC
jgi:hypothetical protein